jgi:hypothetical protein
MGYGHSEAVHAELDYWLGGSRREVRPLSRDYASDPEANTVASAGHVSVALSDEQTRALLQEVPAVYHTQINDVLLTALVQSFRRWWGQGPQHRAHLGIGVPIAQHPIADAFVRDPAELLLEPLERLPRLLVCSFHGL